MVLLMDLIERDKHSSLVNKVLKKFDKVSNNNSLFKLLKEPNFPSAPSLFFFVFFWGGGGGGGEGIYQNINLSLKSSRLVGTLYSWLHHDIS